jgi:hypothetical protein
LQNDRKKEEQKDNKDENQNKEKKKKNKRVIERHVLVKCKRAWMTLGKYVTTGMMSLSLHSKEFK